MCHVQGANKRLSLLLFEMSLELNLNACLSISYCLKPRLLYTWQNCCIQGPTPPLLTHPPTLFVFYTSTMSYQPPPPPLSFQPGNTLAHEKFRTPTFHVMS